MRAVNDENSSTVKGGEACGLKSKRSGITKDTGALPKEGCQA